MAMTRGQVQDLLSKFATEHPNYRDALIKDPKGMVEKQMATTLPAKVKVKAVQETADTIYVVIPHVAAEGELDDADLEKVAGGKGDYDASCDRARGGGSGSSVTMNVYNA